MPLDKLLSIASNPFWVKEDCKIPITLNADVSRTCVRREASKISFDGTFEGDNGDDMVNFFEAINDETTLSLIDYLSSALYSAQSLYGINLAFNSKLYPNSDNLLEKGSNIISIRDNKRVDIVYEVLHEDLRIGIVAKDMNYPNQSKFGQVNDDGVYTPVERPTDVQGTVDMIKDFVDFIMEIAGVRSDSVISYWASSVILKMLQISGSKVARYKSASNYQSFVPDPNETGLKVIAWTGLVKFITTVIGLAGLIVRIIKKKKRKNKVKLTSSYVIIFNRRKHFKVYFGDFTLNNYDAYKKEVQELFNNSDQYAFGIKEDLPIVGITKNGDLPEELLPELFAKNMRDNKLTIKDLIITAEPRYFDYSL
jgi:hypothetical protein